jgi:putative membrane protein
MRKSLLLAAALLVVPSIAAAQNPPAPKLDDAAIVGIFDAANGWDIETGKLAATKATRADIREFGKMISQVHESVQKSGRDLAKKLGVTPTPVAKDFPLLVSHQAAMKKLNSLSGAAFDKAFLEHEAPYHQAVIDAVTNVFLPAIQNAELKKFVSDLAPAFIAHRNQAQELLKK